MSPNKLKKWRYYGPFEVVIHNKPYDCWVSLLGKVFNITPLIEEHKGKTCILPLLAMAGKDIGHWFDEKTGDIIHYIHPVTGNRVPYCPHGVIPDVEPYVPVTRWRPLDRLPWWQDDKLQIGLLTKRVRPLRIVNMLIRKEVKINVCMEDTFLQIQERYRIFCSNIESYNWCYLGKLIAMDKTLDENGIVDERDRFSDLGLPQNYHIPCVFIYFNDDLNDYEPETNVESF